MTNKVPASFNKWIEKVKTTFPENEKLHRMFEKCFTNTYTTTLQETEEGLPFVITGDIPAMWLRDSTSQIRPYLIVAEEDEEMATVIENLVKLQTKCILHDPYANAFNKSANGAGFQNDKTAMTNLVWERKYEIDSLCYPIQLAYLLWKSTNRTGHFTEEFRKALHQIIEVFKIEQKHTEQSPYRFERENVRQSDTLNNNGKGTDVSYTGMSWSGFRPSDDACMYGYLVPSNMFLVVVMDYVQEIAATFYPEDKELPKESSDLRKEVAAGIETYAKQVHPYYGDVYAYEVDGTGRKLFMDDANVPSLLAALYLGFCEKTDPAYQATRKLILSRENPYFVEGSVLTGIGSPHTPDHYVWPIALSIEGLTAETEAEKQAILEMLIAGDGGTDYMHEGVNASNPAEFTRDWFAWSNAMFSEFVLSLCGVYVKGSPLSK
ncbi:glycoside hydrolase family 125 protein [Listeria monocytogenes]|nr:glycoside hydrolase family 125 protein [Listeria monocytogenes]EAE0533536.1 glycoside hydrolase family 125 protein [Listeria monocytogenes]EAE0536614.1 glycoside hydrolase family 125 protein [Listeria monocytogenes]EAE8951993.1 glycoside hydrolase family 125 protein [Listeria monocytogenes]EAE9295747.1 glycoside hydrolase family 125 protein [Listeria monocytogenes]